MHSNKAFVVRGLVRKILKMAVLQIYVLYIKNIDMQHFNKMK